MFFVIWVYGFMYVLYLFFYVFLCDWEVGKVWCNWNKLNVILYIVYGVFKGELILILCFGDFDIDFLKIFF